MAKQANFQPNSFTLTLLLSLHLYLVKLVNNSSIMSNLPPNIKSEDHESLPSTLILSSNPSEPSEPSERNYGGRPQSPVRGWFEEFYVDPTLTGKALHEMDNISAYRCPACGKEVKKAIRYLKRHVLKECENFPQEQKGMLYFCYIHHITYLLFLHCHNCLLFLH